MIELLPVHGLPEITAGEDLAGLLTDRADLRNGDVIVVAQKVISKAEGAVVAVAPGEDVAAARRRLARELSVRVVADTPAALVVQTRTGLICANAGIDASNAAEGTLVLLPDDPDASAARLRQGLRRVAGVDVAVVVADTFGRPWRLGQTDVAIGVAGIAPIRDERGGTDRNGRRLDVTEAAVADELAGAADLVRRKADGIPAVVVRGFAGERGNAGGARKLVRDAAADLFPRGRGMLPSVMAATAQAWPPAWAGPVAVGDLQRAGIAVARALGTRADLPLLHRRGDAPTVVTVRGLRPVAQAVACGLLAAFLTDQGYAARVRRRARRTRVDAGRPQTAPR